MFVLDPDQYLLPDYKISPFRTEDIRLHQSLPPSRDIDDYFAERFHGRRCLYTINGRSAINKALKCLSPTKEDTVTILTTTGNHYVSGCVTGEVGKFCRWNREVNDETRIILVVHEFGYPYRGLMELKRYGLPIIEDVAYAFFSEDMDHTIGRVGDFAVYSFPKMFPVQVGGLLVFDSTMGEVEEETWPDDRYEPYIRKTMSHYVRQEGQIKEKRISNYLSIRERIREVGFDERFALEEGVIPGVFMFRVNDEEIDLKGLRDHFFRHGIQCSVFYGERAFFIPVNQSLTDVDLDFFVAVLQSFLK